MLDALPIIAIASTALIVAAFSFYKRKLADKTQGCTLPPGPRGWPIIGSLLDLPSGEAPWVAYRKWAEIYGTPVLPTIPIRTLT